MNNLRTAAQQALEALEYAQQNRECPSTTRQAISALRAALAQEPQDVELSAALGWPGGISTPILDRAELLRMVAKLAQEQAEPVQAPEPAGWFEAPFGAFRANPLYRIAWPSQTVAWSIPLYTAPPQRPAEPVQEPVAWMREDWGPDCGPYVEFYRDDEMKWRDRKGWTPLFTFPPKEQAEPMAWQCREHGDSEWFHCSKEGYGINPRRYTYRALYADPPQRRPLPEAEILRIRDECLPAQGEPFDVVVFARGVERAHEIW